MNCRNKNIKENKGKTNKNENKTVLTTTTNQ